MGKVIGIVASSIRIKEGITLGSDRTYITTDYIKAVEKAGGTPLIIPLIDDEESIDKLVELCDGIILSGGDDINPLLYGEEPTVFQGMITDERDKVDMMLIDACLKKDKAILGICRGMQMINVYFGGSLYQDLSLFRDCYIGHFQKSHKEIATHTIDIYKDSIIYKSLGEKVSVNSFHHQCINKVGDEIKVVAKSKDGVVEGIELKHNKRIYGVQWHPEMMINSEEMKKLFKDFIKIC